MQNWESTVPVNRKRSTILHHAHNKSWNESQAMTYRRTLEEAGIVCLEGPVSQHNAASLARLSQHLEVPITAGERLFGVEPFVRIL